MIIFEYFAYCETHQYPLSKFQHFSLKIKKRLLYEILFHIWTFIPENMLKTSHISEYYAILRNVMSTTVHFPLL